MCGVGAEGGAGGDAPPPPVHEVPPGWMEQRRCHHRCHLSCTQHRHAVGRPTARTAVLASSGGASSHTSSVLILLLKPIPGSPGPPGTLFFCSQGRARPSLLGMCLDADALAEAPERPMLSGAAQPPPRSDAITRTAAQSHTRPRTHADAVSHRGHTGRPTAGRATLPMPGEQRPPPYRRQGRGRRKDQALPQL